MLGALIQEVAKHFAGCRSQVKHELFKSKKNYKLTMKATKQKKEMITTNDTSRERKKCGIL